MTDKAWFIEYVAHTDSLPTEEEWREYIDRLVETAEQTSHLWEDVA